MTDPVPAIATGLSAASFDRRSFLATLAAAGVLTGGAAAAEPHGAVDHPDAKLLELVTGLFAAEGQWAVIDARADADNIFKRCEALMPAVPPALLFQEGRDTFEICYQPSRLPSIEIDGEPVPHYAEESHVPSLRWAISKWRQHGTGRDVVDRAEEIIAALDTYVAGVKHAEDQSGVTAFNEESSRNQELIDTLNHEIAATSAHTIEGVVAKSRAATEAWGAPSYLASVMLPDMLRNEGIFRNLPFLNAFTLAISVVADAAKLGAATQPSSARVAA